MKTNILTVLLAAVMLAACQSKSYKIEGEAVGLDDGSVIYLTKDLQTLDILDSMVVENGRFAYSGETERAELYALVDEGYRCLMPFFIEPGTIRLVFDVDYEKNHLGGTPTNEAFQELNDSVEVHSVIVHQMEEQLVDSTVEKNEQFFQRLDSALSEVYQQYVNAAERNIDNELGYTLVVYTLNSDQCTPEKLLELLKKMPREMQQRTEAADLLDLLDSPYNQEGLSGGAEEGRPMADFEITALADGKPVSVLGLVQKNKVTLLDFWASWCGPCRSEMPFLKQLQEKYGKQGFAIVGISLDDNLDDWRKAVSELGITWLQGSDLADGEHVGARLFDINSIPFTVLLDGEGLILAKGYRGQALEDVIVEALNE